MRKAIYKCLTGNCQSITRWLQPYQPVADTPKPYGVIVMGDKTLDTFNRLGLYKDLYIWPYVAPNSFIQLDEVAAEITKLLSDVRLTTESGSAFQIEWLSEGRDFYDTDLKAITRRLDFRVPLIV